MRDVVLTGVFAITMFLALFCLLPVGLGSSVNENGAPSNPRILLKLGISIAVAFVVWVIFYLLVLNGVIDI